MELGCLDRGECAWVPEEEWCKWCADNRAEMIRKAATVASKTRKRRAPGIGTNRTFSPHMRLRAGFAIGNGEHSTELRQNRALQKHMLYFPLKKKERK